MNTAPLWSDERIEEELAHYMRDPHYISDATIVATAMRDEYEAQLAILRADADRMEINLSKIQTRAYQEGFAAAQEEKR